MIDKLKNEIKLTRQFRSIREEAMLNLFRTSRAMEDGLVAILKEKKLSMSQYNVLRILQGAAPDGLMCSEIANRMISRDPDMTRLLDRMEKQEWINRERDKIDRRSVLVTITDAGKQLVKSLDAPVNEYVEDQFSSVTQKALRELIDTLEQSR